VGQAPAPLRLPAGEILKQNPDCELVQTEGYLFETTASPSEQTLILQSDDTIFNVLLDRAKAGSRVGRLPNGSLLRVTGVCSVELDAARQPRTFRILLRSPADITILAQPSWWTLRHTLLVVGALTLVVLTAVGWGAMLRRVVHRQTDTIRRQLDQEAALQERYRELFENANDVIYTHDLTGRLTSFNKAGERILGYTRAEVLTKNISQWIAPGCQERFHSWVTATAAGIGPATSEFEMITKDGRVVVQEVSARLIYQNEKPIGVQCTARDITQLKRAEEQIREQSRLLDLAQDAIVVRDLENRILYWNRGAERLYGWTAEAALGRKITELIYRDTTAFEAASADLALKDEWNGELKQFTQDNLEVTTDCRWTLLRDAQGNSKSILAISIDISERRKLETQLLRNQRLESIGTLASGIAHDLNNVLAPVLMSTQLLRTQTFDEEGAQLLSTIEASAIRGADIVKQVTLFARGANGERVPMQLKYQVLETTKMLRQTFPKSITLECKMAPGLWLVTGNATQIDQVLLNLCINARDAMPDGGRLQVTAENVEVDAPYASMVTEAKPGPYVRLEIKDTGTGIEAAILDRIFDPFFTTKAPGKGTGLGLSTVLGIVRSHGGFINVTSAAHNGSTFSVFLPALPGATAPGPDAETPAPPKGNGEVVLVVDDEEAVRAVAVKLLEANGYTALTAVDGADGLAVYTQHRHRVNVVLTDLIMPHMDGATLARVLRKLDPKVRIVASTGLSSLESGAEPSGFKPEEVTALLTKPYTAEKLLHTLHHVIAVA
jgi:PAS domain S-box-containing protein